MPKYLWQVSYTPQGVQGLVKEGGAARRTAVQRLVEQAGGKLESFHFAFGEADAYCIAELPDTVTAAAVSLAVNGVGAVHLRTIPLFTPEELDAATKKSIDYRAPGSAGR
jgi:uncharacterized protein with GYD domain